MHITVVGTGYVGLVTGACFAEFGAHVTCVDKEKDKIDTLKLGKLPIYEPGLQEIVERNVGQERLKFTCDLDRAVDGSLVIFIAVGTPDDGTGRVDLTYVREVAAAIGGAINGFKVIVTKSTVPMGTGRLIRKIVSEKLKKKVRFSVASNPEFLREGSAVEDFMRPNRVVIGAEDEDAVAILKDLYDPLYLNETPFVITDVVTAEMIKYASNAFLATKISFINEVAELCDRAGADVHMVAKGMGLDRRIGSKFLHPGPGYGGSCFPKDTLALAAHGRENDVRMEIVEAAIAVNRKQRDRMMERIRTAVAGTLMGKTVAVLGLSFKPNTNDIRESPAIDIARRLLEEGASVRAYDPVAMEDARRELPQVQFCEDPYDAAAGADALVFLTEWNQFRMLEMRRIKDLMTSPILLDLRNIYEPDQMRDLGFEYIGVGRRPRAAVRGEGS
jgi:UDPglucose 6-dehydrogenase